MITSNSVDIAAHRSPSSVVGAMSATDVERARVFLDSTEDLDAVRQFKDKAAAIASYLAKKEDAEISAVYAGEVARRAERRLGELIRDMPKNGGGQGTGSRVLPVPTLKDHGISKTDSSRWQAIASIPAEKFETRIATCKEQRQIPTAAVFLRLARTLKPTATSTPRRPKSSGAEAALASFARLDQADKQKFLEQLGVVPIAELESRHQQREADAEYAQHRQFRAFTAESVLKVTGQTAGRAHRMIDVVLDGGELALVRLGLDWTVTKESLAKAYKAASLRMHPDRGGSTESFVALTKARDLVARMLEGM